ncbi:phenylalanine--tRNA ligase subunit beta [Candidatus Roizmanbacteria bacterium CG_4_10_14_0_8_um_filter_39_9]|uniref:phenylalanine--tRNA ligase n=1 Tax=Candidatus Roizmanbacteria bacterium CG_4_10_14_0_8_um_filter_39_9 TaxID=1974829 RepID=A0A2M7QD68_9BACT|nr:MAG: phenylalanine--tRNA ligase subunit beta [Candidatus Roizmanbacteria bacterium CG_4_10_14_0_8_um_filter_39_9]
MNIRITHKWLLEYLDTNAAPVDIQKHLTLCGPSVERVDKIADDDWAYDIEITSNRIDTASVYGIAREAQAILKRAKFDAVLKPFSAPDVKGTDELSLFIEDKDKLCNRLLAVVIDNVNVLPSPEYMQSRLKEAGVRSLNNLIDITNYVMIETGHPVHVFDYDRIATGKLIIRHAKKGEELITLDNKKYKLNEWDVIIDDGTGRIIDLPGIMGTANSVVTSKTKRVVLFIESNDPTVIRKTSMTHGIRTMAATYNEKSPDPEIARTALLRGVSLLTTLARGTIASPVYDMVEHPKKEIDLSVSVAYINSRLGIVLTQKEMTEILFSLDFKVVTKNSDIIVLKIPTFRQPDVSIQEDVVEEIARIYGYYNFPNALQPSVYVKQPKEMEDLFVYSHKIKLFLKHLGLHEVLNYSMISKEMIEGVDMAIEDHLNLSNVMSEEIKYLRISLIPSLIKNIKLNEGRSSSINLFELAKVYLKTESEPPTELYKLGMVTTTSFVDLKGQVEGLMSELNIADYQISPSTNPLYAPGIQAKLSIGKTVLGEFGQLKASLKEKNALVSEVFAGELDFSELIANSKPISQYIPVHPYAVIKLDTTIEFSAQKTFAKFKDYAFRSSRILSKLQVVDTYKNKVTLRLYFSSPKENITEETAKKELKLLLTA